MRHHRGFASDNNAGVHPRIMDAIQAANKGHAVAYGADPYTEAAVQTFKEHFGPEIEVYFVFNGTAANVLGLTEVTKSFNSIICTDQAHLHTDECGAPEKYTGCKVLTVPTSDGKLTIEGIRRHIHGFDFEHHAQPKVISVTQATELGTVYTQDEIRTIANYAHENGLLLHMDGARLANAAVHLNCTLREITADVGVDVLSFGGTKNGMMFGEAIVFFNQTASPHFKYVRKQGMQLGSKMRFISAQLTALLSDHLWWENARHSNNMARYLAEKVGNIPGIEITQPVQANGVFAIVPSHIIRDLQERFFFYVWNEETSEVRWMTSFDTTREDIDRFVNLIQRTIGTSG